MDELKLKRPVIPFAPPVYHCKKAVEPFELDGRLDKPFWEIAPYTDLFLDIQGDHMPTPRYETRVKMLWDDENMYFGAELIGDEIWGTLTERDCVIFHDNDFEIFIDPDSDTHQYYEFEMNALNTIWDLFLTKPYRDMGKPLNSWDMKGIRSAVHIDGELNNPNASNKKWSVEVVIPFTSLMECADDSSASRPDLGEFWRVNFSRVQWTVDVEDGKYVKRKVEGTDRNLPEDNWVWAPTGLINIHYPEMWGFVFFVEDDEVHEIPQSEKDKYELRWLYYRQHEHLQRCGSFTTDVEYLKEGIELNITPEVEVTKRSFVASCISLDDKKELWIETDGRIYSKDRN